MATALLDKSRQIKKEADRLLRRTALLEFLQGLGVVTFVGSYSYDLMVDGDIDIHVANPAFTKDDSLAILSAAARTGRFRGYDYYDFTRRRRAGFPKGYYIGFKTRFLGRKWKIDVWFLPQASRLADRTGRLIAKHLTPASRQIILRLKETVKARKMPITSVTIYEAVLLRGVKNITGLKKYAGQ